MVKTFTIATGNVDSAGDMIVLSGIKIPDNLKLFRNFDHACKPLGVIKNTEIKNTEIKNNELVCTFDVSEDITGFYPAIGFNAIKSHFEGEIRVIDEMKLWCVSVGVNPNVDENIKPIE